MSPLKKIGSASQTSEQVASSLRAPTRPATVVESIEDSKNVVKPIALKAVMHANDFHAQVDILTKAFTAEMSRDTRGRANHCSVLHTMQNTTEDKPADKLLDRRKKYNVMRNELSKRSQLVSAYLNKYTKEKEKEKERQREKDKERNACTAGMRRTRRYDHIPSKVDTNLLNLRKYTSLTSLDTLKFNEQTRTQSAIVGSKRTASVENLSTNASHCRAGSARASNDSKYSRPIHSTYASSQPDLSDVQPHATDPLLSPPTTEKFNFYGAQFTRERLKKDKCGEIGHLGQFGVSRALSMRNIVENQTSKPRANTNAKNGRLKEDDNMSVELANIKASYEEMASKLRANPLYTRIPLTNPMNTETIKSPRPVVTTAIATASDSTHLYQTSKPPDTYKMGSGGKVSCSTYLDTSRATSGSLTEEYLKDVNNSISAYLGNGKSSQVVYNAVAHKPPEPQVCNGGSNKLYKSISVDAQLDRLPFDYRNLNAYHTYTNNYNTRNKVSNMCSVVSSRGTSSLDFKGSRPCSTDRHISSNYERAVSDSTGLNQLKNTQYESGKRSLISLPSPSGRGGSTHNTTVLSTVNSNTYTADTSSLSTDESLRIHEWIDNLSRQDTSPVPNLAKRDTSKKQNLTSDEILSSRQDFSDGLSGKNMGSKQESYMRHVGSTLMRQDSLMGDDDLAQKDNLAVVNNSDLIRQNSLSLPDNGVSKDEEKVDDAVRRAESEESGDVHHSSTLLKSKWLSLSMPSELNDDNDRSMRSILKKKKRVRINLEFNKTYVL